MSQASIGLDIGSSAVRAAEVDVEQGRRVVRRYGQVGLEPGWVVDGEIVNVAAVAGALRRLWSSVGFRTHEVVVGVSGPRVFVRQAEVPATDAGDLRSSLRFSAGDLLPIPLEDTSFDFSLLDRDAGDDGQLRLLLVAGHQDTLRGYLAATESAGLSAVAIDAAPLALLRAVPPTAGQDGLEVIVSIGAELTTVAVRDAGVPRFIRTLTIGGNHLTQSLADSLHLEMATAERLKRGVVPDDHPQLGPARRSLGADIRDLAEDVRATVDFFAAQADGKEIERLLITGGASQTHGLATAIAGQLPVEVYEIAPFAGLEIDDLGLDPEALSRAAHTATTAVGLALWSLESPLIRLSILPEEVAQSRRSRRMVRSAATGLAGLVAVLAVAGAAQLLRVHDAEGQVSAADRQIAQLNSQVQTLQAQTAVHGQAVGHARIEIAALTGDVDWDRVIEQLAAAMPANVSLTSFSAARTNTPGQTGAASQVTGTIGTLDVSVTGTGTNANDAAAWLDSLLADQDLTGTRISGISVSNQGGGTVSFSSTSYLTPSAESPRAHEVNQ